MRRDIHPFAVAKQIRQRTGLLKRQGAYLVNWYKVNSSLDYTVKKMYVVKYNKGIFKRGQKLFTKPPEVECREIFYYPKETREKLRELIQILDKPTQNQIGFCNHRGINDSMKILEMGKTFYTMDLSNAFDSITREMIYYILKVVYDVNRKLATKISYLWTKEGHMMQGHPLAPLIFNLWTSQANNFLTNNGVKMLQYADDLIVASDYDYITFNRMKFIKNAFKRIGFDININKTHIIHKNREVTFLGLNQTRNQCKNKAKAKRKLKHLEYLAKKYGENCLRPKNNADTEPKGDRNKDILEGNRQWVNYNPIKPPKPKTATRKPESHKDLWKIWTNPAAIH